MTDEDVASIMQRVAETAVFPCAPPADGGFYYAGLTKRELFAAMAMQGYVTNGHNLDQPSMKRVADMSVARADALLAALDGVAK
jgi:hypothetical protein